MLQGIFCFIMGSAVLYGCITGRGDVVFQSLLQGAKDAVWMALGMAGSFGIFQGLMRILSHCGVMELLKKGMRKPLKWLMGDVKEEALGYVTMNLSANMLGLGNAATPMGIEAAKRLSAGSRATNGLCMFLVINSSSVQLLPTTVVALRAAQGAMDPGAVILPGLLATALSTLVGILCCKWMEKRA